MQGKLLFTAFLAVSISGCFAFPALPVPGQDDAGAAGGQSSQVHPIVGEIIKNSIHARIESLLTDPGKIPNSMHEIVDALAKNFHQQKLFGTEAGPLESAENDEEAPLPTGFWTRQTAGSEGVEVTESVVPLQNRVEPETTTMILS